MAWSSANPYRRHPDARLCFPGPCRHKAMVHGELLFMCVHLQTWRVSLSEIYSFSNKYLLNIPQAEKTSPKLKELGDLTHGPVDRNWLRRGLGSCWDIGAQRSATRSPRSRSVPAPLSHPTPLHSRNPSQDSSPAHPALALTFSMRDSTAWRVTQQRPPDTSPSWTMSPLWLQASYSSWLKYSTGDIGQGRHPPAPWGSEGAPW